MLGVRTFLLALVVGLSFWHLSHGGGLLTPFSAHFPTVYPGALEDLPTSLLVQLHRS